MRKETDVKTYAVPDRNDGAIMFKVLCDDCATELREAGNSASEGESEPLMPSFFYKVVSFILLFAGILGGIFFGALSPRQVIEYEYPSIQSGEKIVEKFNAPLMLYTWIATVILFFCFFAVYAHLRNQEAILKEIRKKSTRRRSLRSSSGGGIGFTLHLCSAIQDSLQGRGLPADLPVTIQKTIRLRFQHRFLPFFRFFGFSDPHMYPSF